MNKPINIEHRKPIWIALSEFYLDTDLEESNFRHIAQTIIDSPFTLDEVKIINKYEVFPVLHTNLLSTAGEWAGFDEDWLVGKIASRLENKSMLNDIGLEISYLMNKWMLGRYWGKLERMYTDIKNNPQ